MVVLIDDNVQELVESQTYKLLYSNENEYNLSFVLIDFPIGTPKIAYIMQYIFT